MPTDAAAAPSAQLVRLPSLLAVETAVGTVVNIALNLLFAWLTFPAGAPVTVWGSPGLAIDLLPATLIPAFMMTLVVTATLRARLRGRLRVAAAPPPPIRLPRRLALRALTIAALALILIAAPTLAVLALAWPAAGNWTQLIAYKLIFSAFHAAVLTPFVILAGLAERR